MPRRLHILALALAAAWLLASDGVRHAAADAAWPRWRGPHGNAVSSESGLPVAWDRERNIAWRTGIPGEGSSSPIVHGDRVFVTSSREYGTRRLTHCLSATDGQVLWTRELADENPEITSALTGHAAATPATDGQRVVAFFGNAGLVAYDFAGRLLWHRDFGEFDSELGLASSPVFYGDTVVQLCDHDGKWYSTFDSFLIAVDAATGETRWRTERRGLERSWSTPIVIPLPDNAENESHHDRLPRHELVVAAQDELRAYDPQRGDLLWRVTGLTGWVTPSPVFAEGLIFATSGKNGPVLAVRPGGRGDVGSTHVAWKEPQGGPYVCSPLAYRGRLYVVNEAGVLSCRSLRDGRLLYRQRLNGKFTASPVAAAGRLYLVNEDGTTYVVAAEDAFQLVATNRLDEFTLASPAIANGRIYIRTEHKLWCIAAEEPRP
jgi:outer membrane protein assembly factor BamB